MKKTVKGILALIIVIISTQNVNAQKTKLGHVNTTELMQQLYVKDSIEQQLTSIQQYMQADIQKKQQELQASYQKFMAEKDTLPEYMVKMREESLAAQQQQLQTLPQEYDQRFQAAQQELVEPLRTKVQKAITKVSKTQAFTYVFDSAALLYSGGGTDITELVRVELGLPKPAAGATATGTSAK